MELDWMSPMCAAGAPEVGTVVRREALRDIINKYPPIDDPSGYVSDVSLAPDPEDQDEPDESSPAVPAVENRGGAGRGGGRKRKFFAEPGRSAKQVADRSRAVVRVPNELKHAAMAALLPQDGKPVKANAFAQLVQRLLEREIAERDDPGLAQKRCLGGTLLEDLVEPRQRRVGTKIDDDDAIQTYLLQKSTLIEFIESGDLRCKCGGKFKHAASMYEGTAGQFTFKCTNKVCSKCLHYHTQRRSGKDYTLNSTLVASAEVNTINLQHLNNVLKELKACPFSERFHTRITREVNEKVMELGKECTDEALQEFKAQEQRDCEGDCRFDSSRDAKFATFGVVNQSNNKIIFAQTAKVSETPTGNAWKAEDYLGSAFFKKLEEEVIELDNWVHDACAKLSQKVQPHRDFFKAKATREGNPNYEPRTVDNNDTFHSQGSFKKLWQGYVDLHTKAIKKGNKTKGTTKEPQQTIKDKDIARAQLRHDAVKGRIEKAFMQVTGSVHATCPNETVTHKTKLAQDTLAEMLINCLVYDNHEICAQVCGEGCACKVRGEFERYFGTRNDQGNELDSADMCGHCQIPLRISDPAYNQYTLQQEFSNYFKAVSQDSPPEVAESVEDDDEAAAAALDAQNADATEQEMLDGPGTLDPYQPKQHVITHPLAIKCLLSFLNSKKLATIIAKNVNCKSTSMIESFNSLITVYAPKRIYFGRHQQARVAMATLDWNENVQRVVVEAANGRRYTRYRDKTFRWQGRAIRRALGPTLW